MMVAAKRPSTMNRVSRRIAAAAGFQHVVNFAKGVLIGGMIVVVVWLALG